MGKKPSGVKKRYVEDDREVEQIVANNPGYYVEETKGGSHKKVRAPDGTLVAVFYRLHGGRDKYPKGTGSAIFKALAAAGLVGIVFVGTLYFLLAQFNPVALQMIIGG